MSSSKQYRVETRRRPAIGDVQTQWSEYFTGPKVKCENRMLAARKEVGGVYAGEPEYRIVAAN